MKKIMLAAVLMAASSVSFSQVPPEPVGDPLPLTIDGPGKGNHDNGSMPLPKSPVQVPTVFQNGHTLYLYSGCTDATLRLLDADEEEVFSTEITDEMDEICIPSTLVGTYRLEIIRGTFTFYCEIEL